MSYADILISGGRVWRGLREGFAEAVAIHGGRVVAAGARDAVAALAGPGTRRIDLGGRLAVPAFNDSHQHLLPMGLGMGQVNLRAPEVSSLDLLLGRIRDAAQGVAKGGWIVGRGWDDTELRENRYPTADELEAAAPGHPVLAVRTCGHAAVASRTALALAGIGDDTPDPPGGAIERREGRANGVLHESAIRLVRAHIAKPDDAALVDAIERAGRHMLSLGFAAVMDANVGMVAGMREVDAYHAARDAGRLPVRVWGCLAGNPDGIADEVWARGIRPMDGCDMLRWGAMKVFADGSAGGRTAAMSQPYAPHGNEAPGTGMFIFPREQFHGLLDKYHRLGWQLAIHAIGDAGIEVTLAGFEAMDTAAHPLAGRRHRIEHCEFVRPDQIARMAARGVEAVPQMIFMHEFGDMYVQNLGRARAEAANPMRAWIEAGMHPAAGSDAPVSEMDAMPNIHAMVTRTTRHGTVLGAEQAVSLGEAMHAYTWAGAYTQFAEAARGRLVAGQLADVAVLSRDVFTLDPAELLSVRADMTLRGGAVVYDRHG
ncbi:MAG: amidohydrolase [Acetobacteraceae bacterium]|nr:amidohydrolase [Acetobacteraceae bacterium]